MKCRIKLLHIPSAKFIARFERVNGVWAVTDRWSFESFNRLKLQITQERASIYNYSDQKLLTNSFVGNLNENYTELLIPHIEVIPIKEDVDESFY